MNRREAIQRTALAMGYAITGPALIGVLNGCQANPELPFKPEFFTEEQAALVADLTEIIIPRTDTPGAKDAGVPMFIDSLLKGTYGKEGQEAFLKNLNEFNEDARAAYGKNFISCKEEEKVAHFKKHHDKAISDTPGGSSTGWWNAGVSGSKPFVLEIKELTLLGFFISEPGATQVLQYNQVPGPYKGCVPLSQVGKTWAT